VRVLRWAGPALAVVEALLVLTGRLSVGRAVVVLVAVEALLAVTAVGTLLAGVRRFGAARAAGADGERALADALRQVLPGPVAAALLHEARIVRSLVLLLTRRRHGVPAGAVPVAYERALRPMGVTFLALAVVEVVVVEVAVPWRALRLVLLLAGLYTLLLVAGITAGNVVRPHVVTGTTLRLRSGTWADVAVPVAAVAAVGARRRAAPDRTVVVADGVLTMGIGGGTTVDVELSGPVPLTVGRHRHEVRALRFAADDPAAAVAAVRAARGEPAGEPPRRASPTR
jgi:hypothetical protein